MLPGFQQYLVYKGFKRTCLKFGKEVNDYESIFISTYGPLIYEFRKDTHYCYWGLSEYQKPPVLYLGGKNIEIIQNFNNFRTQEDGYRILFSMWKEDKFDEIYDAFISDNKHFEVNCSDESNISIKIIVT